MNCELCSRNVEVLTRHHLTPKQRGGKNKGVAFFCLACKDMVHRLFTNKELERKYNTVEKLKATKRVQKYIKWVQKQKSDNINMKLKKRRLSYKKKKFAFLFLIP